MGNPEYTIDTCSLVIGWSVYPPDIFPGLWSNLEALIQKGMLRATEEVLEELRKKDDELLKWAKRQDGFFVPIDLLLQQQVRKVLSDFPSLYDLEKNKSGADPFVIAQALQFGYTIVTEEKKSGNPIKPKIPNVCDAYGIKHINLLALLREQGTKLMSTNS